MNFIDKSALNIAQSIRKYNSNAGSEIALKYALVLILNTSIAILLSLVICMFTGHVVDALISSAGFLLLRYFAGGLHLNSSLGCTLFSSLLVTLIAHSVFSYYNLGLYFNVVSVLILIFTAPSGIEGFSRIEKKYYPILKLIAIIIVFTNIFIFKSSVLSSTFLTTALLTTKPAFMIVDFIERRTQQ